MLKWIRRERFFTAESAKFAEIKKGKHEDFLATEAQRTQRVFSLRKDFLPRRKRRGTKKFWPLISQIDTDLEAEKLKCKTQNQN